MFRTDRNNNPAAFTTDIARQAGLTLGVEYASGDAFPSPSRLVTAKLLVDPVDITIKVIDKVGYYTGGGLPRWTYIAIPAFIWQGLNRQQKVEVIKFHYKHEGGTELWKILEGTNGH